MKSFYQTVLHACENENSWLKSNILSCSVFVIMLHVTKYAIRSLLYWNGSVRFFFGSVSDGSESRILNDPCFAKNG